MYPMKANPIQSGIGCRRNNDMTPRPPPSPELSVFALFAPDILYQEEDDALKNLMLDCDK